MFKKSKKAISLILTLLVIAAVLTGLLLVSQIIIRYSQTIKDIELSEKAYFAAESALEIVAYDILENYEDYTAYSLSGCLSDQVTEYELDQIILDSNCPSPNECDSGKINNDNPWRITLSAGQSFQLNLDVNLGVNGVNYPTLLTITRSSTQPSEVIFGSAPKATPPLNWTQTTYSAWPVSLKNLDSSSNYYRVRINNLGDTGDPDVTYTIEPNAELFIGFKVKTKGIYPTNLGRYERKAEANFYQYQKLSSF